MLARTKGISAALPARPWSSPTANGRPPVDMPRVGPGHTQVHVAVRPAVVRVRVSVQGPAPERAEEDVPAEEDQDEGHVAIGAEKDGDLYPLYGVRNSLKSIGVPRLLAPPRLHDSTELRPTLVSSEHCDGEYSGDQKTQPPTPRSSIETGRRHLQRDRDEERRRSDRWG
jgi:hypothetical protein